MTLGVSAIGMKLRRSSPNVDIGPCPGTNCTSSPSVNSFSRMAQTNVS